MSRSEAADRPANRLQRELADRLVDLLSRSDIEPGARLAEHALARRLNVSRTPIRGALRHLAAQGIVGHASGRGYALLRRPEAPAAVESSEGRQAEDRLIIAVAQDRLRDALDDHVSEADLTRRYGASRQVVGRALAMLAEAGLISRRPGYGWMFEPLPNDRAAREESYRFRVLIEPAALVEPGFTLDRAWAAEMRDRHEQALAQPWSDTSSVAFFEMNAAFHEGLARQSGNRFIQLAVAQQNRVRRFRNYNWTLGVERVVVNCRQHLEILDRLEDGDGEVAALLMRRHIEQARRLPT